MNSLVAEPTGHLIGWYCFICLCLYRLYQSVLSFWSFTLELVVDSVQFKNVELRFLTIYFAVDRTSFNEASHYSQRQAEYFIAQQVCAVGGISRMHASNLTLVFVLWDQPIFFVCYQFDFFY
jgi:hypothetical protein